MIRTANPVQGAEYCTDLKEDPRHPNPQMKRRGWTASEGRQRPKTALIVLISRDDRTSVLQPKHFANRAFSSQIAMVSTVKLLVGFLLL